MIPRKNYIKVISMFVIVIVASLVCSHLYFKNQEHVKTIPVLRGVVNEIKSAKELDNYIMENNDALIYVGVASDNNCRELEEELITLLKKNNLLEEVVYLNISDFNDKEKNDFYADFNKKYGDKKVLDNYPAFIIFNEGKAFDIVSRTNKQELQIGDIDILIDQYELAK